jgi:hypothetical protein
MEIQTFKESLKDNAPPSGLTPALHALWFAGNENWEQAHEIVQDEQSADCAWVHAFLHRQEGDYPNACYWYARAKRTALAKNSSLSEEWGHIAETLLETG